MSLNQLSFFYMTSVKSERDDGDEITRMCNDVSMTDEVKKRWHHGDVYVLKIDDKNNVIDRRRDLGSGNELLKLLTGEITNAYGFGEPHILSLFHAFPQRLYVNRKKIFFWNWYLAHFFAQPQRPVYQKQIKVFQLKIPTLHRPQIKRFYDDQETVRTFLDFHSIPVAYMASKVGGFCICVCFGRDFTRGFS